MISGQSSRRSRPRSRILVRNRATFEGPEEGCVVVVEGGLSVFDRKLLDLEEVLVEEDILEEASYPDALFNNMVSLLRLLELVCRTRWGRRFK